MRRRGPPAERGISALQKLVHVLTGIETWSCTPLLGGLWAVFEAWAKQADRRVAGKRCVGSQPSGG